MEPSYRIGTRIAVDGRRHTMAQLEPCPSCARHVRVQSSACPFCRTALSDSFRATPPRARPRRLGRAAMFAVGAALATPGCYLSHEVGRADAAVTRDASTAPGPVYGGPPTPVDAGIDYGGTAILYGIAPSALDAGEHEDAGGVSADYGSPPRH